MCEATHREILCQPHVKCRHVGHTGPPGGPSRSASYVCTRRPAAAPVLKASSPGLGDLRDFLAGKPPGRALLLEFRVLESQRLGRASLLFLARLSVPSIPVCGPLEHWGARYKVTWEIPHLGSGTRRHVILQVNLAWWWGLLAPSSCCPPCPAVLGGELGSDHGFRTASLPGE